MQEAPTPLDERQRLRSLLRLQILDSPSEERFDRITRMAKRFFGVQTCLLSLVDADRQWFKSKVGLGATETPRNISFCGHAILDDDVFVVSDTSKDTRFFDNPLVTGGPKIAFYAGCPLAGPKGYRIGTLCLIDPKPREMSAADRATLRDLAAMIEDELRMTAEATVDHLTQIANRRGFHDVANRMLAVCRRTDTPAEVLFFDLDGFKTINDTYGHNAGDDLLVHFARLLLQSFRSADVVARLGGDEFVVLMVGSAGSSGAAMQRMQHLAGQVDCDVRRLLAWSSGSTIFDPERHESIECLLQDADRRMYDDKERRRGSAN